MIFTLLVGVSVALLLFFLNLTTEEHFGAVLWKSIMTVLRSSFPGYHDGGPLYLFLVTFAAICGMLVTSVLIGIVSSAIREKINNLRRGNSKVLERGHIVVLGFYPGEYTLLKQLVLAAAGDPCCIVVAENMDRTKMEEAIAANIKKLPKNVRIICRTADIFDPATLEKCSLKTCRSIIISPTDDTRTIKALLAVSTIIKDSEDTDVRIGAIISKDEYQFPTSLAVKYNVTTLQTNDTMARIIAHSCTQPGLSATFTELFNFEGCELYNVEHPKASGLSFLQLSCSMDKGVPIGINRNGEILLNPGLDEVIRESDHLVVFSEESDSSVVIPKSKIPEISLDPSTASTRSSAGKVVILGCNETISTILHELPEDVHDALIAGNCDKAAIRAALSDRPGLSISFFDGDYTKSATLTLIAKQADHIVVLSDHTIDEEKADMQSTFLLLNLRDIKNRFGLNYNITVEMRREHNQSLVVSDDNTDYVVSSNMSALFLAQLAESPELTGAFREILSNSGNELYLKKSVELQCSGEHSISELRKLTLLQGYILLGYMRANTFKCTFNPPLNDTVDLTAEDSVIVLGEM